MLVIKKLIVVNLQFFAEVTPEFFNRITLIFHGLQKTLHLFIVGSRSFNGSRFRGVLVVLTDAANDPIQIAVDVMEEEYFFHNIHGDLDRRGCYGRSIPLRRCGQRPEPEHTGRCSLGYVVAQFGAEPHSASRSYS